MDFNIEAEKIAEATGTTVEFDPEDYTGDDDDYIGGYYVLELDETYDVRKGTEAVIEEIKADLA